MESNNAEEDLLYSEVGNFYLNNDKLHDVQFIVGEQQEKIKAVKLPLINQSRTWWSMLSEDSPLAEKGDIRVPDIDPEVFTLLLKAQLEHHYKWRRMRHFTCEGPLEKVPSGQILEIGPDPWGQEVLSLLGTHSYGGLETLDNLSDDIVVKLCYCANKYFMKSLMTKIANRLEPTDVDSVFPALHCLAYYNLHGVENGVKKIVQAKTTQILNHAEFLECDVDSVTYICKQDTLNCDELTLWKAVVNWAKHKANGDEGAQLRQWMAQPLKHIRLLTLNKLEMYDHVFAMGVLNGEEITNICKGDVSGMPICANMLVTIPTVINNQDVLLLANSKYMIELEFSKDMPGWKKPKCVNGHKFEHGTYYCSFTYNNDIGVTPCHIVGFSYGV